MRLQIARVIGLALALLVLLIPAQAEAATGGTDVCGSLSSFSRATATTNNVLSLAVGGALVNYQLVLSGTFPPDLGARSTAFFPEIVHLVGRPIEGINAVADYTVTRVASCSGLPNTSTAPESTRETAPAPFGIAVLLLLGATAWMRAQGSGSRR